MQMKQRNTSDRDSTVESSRRLFEAAAAAAATAAATATVPPEVDAYPVPATSSSSSILAVDVVDIPV
jgi:hypothetical protein